MIKHIFLIIFLALSIVSLAQHRNVLISDERKPNEVSIALNENKPSHMIVGANIASYYLSKDGGLTWSSHMQKSPFGVWGDPVMAIDTAGNYFHFHLSKPEKDGHWIDRIVCQKSTDKGVSFNEGSYTGLNSEKEQDKHWVAINPMTNELYLTWTQFDEYGSESPDKYSNILFSKSTDSGETWSEPIQINSTSGDCIDDDNTVEGAVPAVGPNGEIYVSWAGPNGLVFNRSFDNGLTWENEEIKIDSMPNGWSLDVTGIYRSNGMPITKCDISDGPNRGTIYVNWADQRNGSDDSDIWLVKSTDQGITWTEPIRVNQDTTQTQQFFTWMDIDQTNGNLFFVYHDRRKSKSDETDVYLTLSKDGGNSFEDFLISDKSFKPNETEFFGDYNNIVAHNGLVRPVWTRMDNKQLSIWTAIIDTDLIINAYNSDFTLSYNDDLQSIYFTLGVEATVDIKLVDVANEEIMSWTKWEVNGVRNALLLKNQLEKGIYYLEVTKGGKEYRRTVIID